jgi:hypothetical protein
LDELRATLSGVSSIATDADELVATGEAFLGNDFSPLPFLVSETGARTKLTRFILRDGSKQKAKEWLQAKEAALREAHGVNRLEW